MNNKIIPGLIVLLLMLVSTPSLAQQGPVPRVTTVQVSEQLLAPQIKVPGTVISRNDARIAAEVSGAIIWIAEVGDQIAEGGVLARIDDRTAQVLVAQAEATVARLEVDFLFRNQEVARIQDLAATNNTPVSRLQEVIAQRDMAEQDLILERAALQRARDDLTRTVVKAPFPGRVVARLSQAGEYATPGEELVRLVNTDNVEIRVQAPIAVANSIYDGLNVEVEGEGVLISTPIRTVIRVGDEVSRMMEVRISVDPGVWVIGSAVTVGLPSAVAREVVAVPRDALILRANSTYVFRITDENVAERIAVTTGVASGDLIEVIGLIAAGDQVVIRGGERLRGGQTVELSELEN